MTQIPEELVLYRTQLRDAIERDLARRAPRSRALPTFAVLAAASAAVVLGLTLTAASAPTADAAAKKALARTEAASGTMTLAGGATAITTRWNDGKDVVPLLGRVKGPGVLAGRVQLARSNVAGDTADQILALATGIRQTTQPDGTTVYTGTTAESTVDPDTLFTSSDDVLMRRILADRLGNAGDTGMQFRMTAGSDGSVQEVDLTSGETLKSTCSDLGSTSPISAPANATEMAPDAVPPDVKGGGEVFAAK